MWVLIFITSMWAIDFDFNISTEIIVEMDDQLLANPFSGGVNQPKVQWIDWDVDGDSDLFIMDADGNLRYYQNNSENEEYLFTLITTQFHGISTGGWFFFGDFNNDTHLDLVVQDAEILNNARYYQFDGDSFISVGLIPLSQDNGFIESDPVMTPTFADIDDDGDLDFFTGNVIGTVSYYENIGFQDGIPQYEYMTNMWQDISIIGPSLQRHGASAINFIDLDGDGDFDLSWGDYFQQSLYIVWNVGSAQSPMMDIVNITSQYPINDPVFSAGQNMPTFTDIDLDGDPDLFLSVLSGAYGSQTVNNFIFYENLGSAVSPFFEYRTHNFLQGIDLLTYTSPTFYDIDIDGDLDMFLGTKSDPSQPSWSGKVHFFLNIGNSTQPHFQLQTDNLFQGIVGYNLAPAFGDVDGDGEIDVIIGDSNGYLHHFKGEGDLQFYYLGLVPDIDLSGNSDPILIDADGDGVLELLVGELNGNVNSYAFIEGQFVFIHSTNLSTLGFMYTTLDHYDIDNDGDSEIIMGSWQNGISFFESQNGGWSLMDINIPFTTLRSSPAITDINNDGVLDLFVGNPSGGLYYLEGISDSSCSPGDVNVDGVLNILDIVQIVNIILDQVAPDATVLCAADVNEDGIVDILDIVLMVNIIMGNG
ncbi:MAG: VCBS repeat-containing protein [Candidatus Marinimicrobia bacterium]|nr:VCBS repeat-containing protein [Candidatus Neomarinimicrobiota bacterium]